MENKPQTEKAKSIFKEWLEKLQQESWQLELLISGFAIYGIYSARTLITDLSFFNDYDMDGESKFIVSVVGFIFRTGWLIFFLNLLVHVILRGLWIGAIGLRYVSQDIDYDVLGYSTRFTDFLRKNVGSYDDFIESLEKICSVIFAFTFLLFLLFASLMVFVLQTILIIALGQKFFDGNSTIVSFFVFAAIFYFGFGCIVFIDLISLGLFKKIKEKYLSSIYFYLYRFISIVTLSFLYRALLYNFIDNKYTRKLFYLSIPYIFIIVGGYTMFENTPDPFLPPSAQMLQSGTVIDDNYYDDLRSLRLNEYPNEERKLNKETMKWVSLESFTISSSVSSVFIKINRNLTRLLEKDSSISPFKKQGISFSWFNLNEIKSEKLKEIESRRSKELAGLFDQRRAMNKQYKISNKSGIKSEIDSLTNIIDIRSSWWDNKINEFTNTEIRKIINAYTSNMKLFLDSIPIELTQCFYYRHPHFDEHGLKCFFETDSIAKGLHNVKFVKQFLSKNSQTITKDSITLPIIKQ